MPARRSRCPGVVSTFRTPKAPLPPKRPSASSASIFPRRPSSLRQQLSCRQPDCRPGRPRSASADGLQETASPSHRNVQPESWRNRRPPTAVSEPWKLCPEPSQVPEGLTSLRRLRYGHVAAARIAAEAGFHPAHAGAERFICLVEANLPAVGTARRWTMSTRERHTAAPSANHRHTDGIRAIPHRIGQKRQVAPLPRPHRVRA